MIKAVSQPNIAFIKYWGNRNDTLRLPAADSLSMTLDHPSVTIEMEEADEMHIQSFDVDGGEKELNDTQRMRFVAHHALVQEYIRQIDKKIAMPYVSINVHSAIPSGIGLASSAAVFSAVAKCYAGLLQEKISLTDTQTSVIARLGSGSASRSVFGGFVAMYKGDGDDIDGSVAKQIADENHWTLHDIVIAPSVHHKKVGSTEGHALAHTSPHMRDRIAAIPHRMTDAVDAIKKKDFEKLRHASEEDALDMHRVMETSEPSLQYLNDETHRIMKEIEHLRNDQHLPVLYTMDAGPTVHLVCTEEALDAIKDYAQAQKDCTVFETKIGKGAAMVD